MKNILFALMVIVIATPVQAIENKTSLTATKLLSDGYIKMSGAAIRKNFIGPTLIIMDLLAGSEYEAIFSPDGKSKLKKIKGDKAQTLTDADYQGRAVLLTGINAFTIKGNTFITTDGIRSYTSTLYKKGDVVLGVRNVDNGRVYFQVKLKNR